jgi:hypothetical protein
VSSLHGRKSRFAMFGRYAHFFGSASDLLAAMKARHGTVHARLKRTNGEEYAVGTMQTVLNAEKDAEQVKQEVLQLYEKVRALGAASCRREMHQQPITHCVVTLPLCASSLPSLAGVCCVACALRHTLSALCACVVACAAQAYVCVRVCVCSPLPCDRLDPLSRTAQAGRSFASEAHGRQCFGLLAPTEFRLHKHHVALQHNPEKAATIDDIMFKWTGAILLSVTTVAACASLRV